MGWKTIKYVDEIGSTQHSVQRMGGARRKVASVIGLGICGAHKPEGIWVIISRICTLYYFLHFLVILPILGKLERPLPLPESISRPVTGGGGPMPSGAAAKPMEKA